MHFKITACISVPRLSKLCNIRNTTLMNYWWHNGYGNGHWLIISHSLFHIGVPSSQHESKLFSTHSSSWKTSSEEHYNLVGHHCCDGNIARQHGLGQSRVVRRSLGYHILIGKLLAKHTNLKTSKYAKCKDSLWTQRIFFFFFPSIWW